MAQIQNENSKIIIILNCPGFDEIFLEAIDYAFSKLGINIEKKFIGFLGTKYNMTKEEIPARIGDFVDALEKIFGAGSLPLELSIMKALRLRVPSFNYLADNSDLYFEAYVASLKEYTENL